MTGTRLTEYVGNPRLLRCGLGAHEVIQSGTLDQCIHCKTVWIHLVRSDVSRFDMEIDMKWLEIPNPDKIEIEEYEPLEFIKCVVTPDSAVTIQLLIDANVLVKKGSRKKGWGEK